MKKQEIGSPCYSSTVHMVRLISVPAHSRPVMSRGPGGGGAQRPSAMSGSVSVPSAHGRDIPSFYQTLE